MPDTPSATVDEVVAALAAQAPGTASAPVDITVDGHAGKSITLQVPADIPYSAGTFSTCNGEMYCLFVDPQIDGDLLVILAALRADLVDARFQPAGADIVIHFGDAADDEVVGLADRAAEIRQPRHRVRTAKAVQGFVAEAAAIDVGKLAFGNRGSKRSAIRTAPLSLPSAE